MPELLWASILGCAEPIATDFTGTIGNKLAFVGLTRHLGG
jgi:hypothetical protein